MDIAIARGGQVITQVTREEAEAALRSGQLLETDYYWQPGMPAWRPLPLLFAAKVALPFARPVPKEPSLLDRLLRRRSESECLARYWDLLAVAPDHGAVDPAALDALDAGCGCKVRSRCVRALRQWYSAYVGMVLSDGALASEDRILLTRVATAFGIPVSRAEEELRAAVLLHYGQQLPLILRADQSVEAAVGAVRRLEAALDLPEAQVAALRAPHLEAHFGYLIGSASDANVTPLVARSIRAQAAAFGFDLAAHGDLAARLARAETHWEAEHGELPVIQVGLILGHGEVCHWTSPAELMQMKRVTTGVSYSGPVATIRIMRGLSWRMASYRGQRETSDEVVSLDKGQVFITSKRVIFDGPLKNLVIRHDKVIDLNAYKNAFQVEQATGISPYFVLPDGDPILPYRMLTRLCREAQA